MKVRGPLVTLGAVGALAGGLWLGNVSQQPAPAPSPAAEAVAAPSTSAAPGTPAAPTTTVQSAPAFPARADYVGTVPTKRGTITLDITVEGDKAIAYACDGASIESWLRGSAVNGAVSLANKDKTSRLEGRLRGTTVVGTLWIADKRWEFSAPAVQSPAGLYTYEQAGVRGSWIVDANGAVTGVLRRNDGSIEPAPILTTDGTAVIDGRQVTAARVGGASDV